MNKMLRAHRTAYKFAKKKKVIRIYHECKGRIEKFVLRIAIWYHEAC